MTSIAPAPRRIGRRARSRLFAGPAQGLLFVAPSLLLFALVLGFPIVYAATLALYQVKPDFSLVWVGAANVRSALASRHFWNALANTGIDTVASVGLHLVVGVGLALMLASPLVRGRFLFRIAFLLPWTLSFVVTGVTWRWIFNSEHGVLNAMLRQVGVLSGNITWLGSDVLAMPAVILVNV